MSRKGREEKNHNHQLYVNVSLCLVSSVLRRWGMYRGIALFGFRCTFADGHLACRARGELALCQ